MIAPVQLQCPECFIFFIKTKKKQVCCTPECQEERDSKLDKLRSRRYQEERIARNLPRVSLLPEEDRLRDTPLRWKRYMEKNPEYFKMVFPESTLDEAIQELWPCP
jgi:hypothetical protein